ncbi:MAG: sortase [Clostridia bacterium]|nr:sortase [Clostridia bacterium]
MRIKVGLTCIILGSVLILSAMLLYIHNSNEEAEAGQTSQKMLAEVVEAIKERSSNRGFEEKDTLSANEQDSDIESAADENDMLTVEVGGYSYIGYLYIPTLENLELPCMAQWSYDLLKQAPCRYSGSAMSDDLVLLGHNYTVHFGKLSRLEYGDRVYFTDMDGTVHTYEVLGIDVLKDTDVENMTSGEYDLSLFTCDYSGVNRLTVRCDRVS